MSETETIQSLTTKSLPSSNLLISQVVVGTTQQHNTVDYDDKKYSLDIQEPASITTTCCRLEGRLQPPLGVGIVVTESFA